MLTANTIKYLRSLRQGKFRQKYNNFVAEGNKCVSEFLRSGRYEVEAIYATAQWIDQHSDYKDRYQGKISVVDEKIMKKITLLTTPTEVLLLAKQEYKDLSVVSSKSNILYLDNIQNPGNMGTILRTADWYGLHQVVCSSDCVDYYHPKVVQAAMGSHNAIEYYVEDLAQLKEATRLPVWGTSLEGSEDFGNDRKPKIIVIGNEGKGIRPAYMPLVDQKVKIAGSPNRVAESLNAGIATAIILDRLLS